jgi:translocation and assembly module TamB
MDITVSADSLDAAVALAYFATLQDVTGTVSGDVRIGGTPVEPAPSGVVTLEDAAWTIEALGVRHAGVSGSLDWGADQTVIAELVTSGSGTSRVTGSVTLQPFSNPTLDLSVEFDRFLAMQRRDMEGWISGAFALTGTYRRPLAEGTLSVDEGILYVEEFARSAGVVDLSDPSLFVEQDLAVDTTIFVARPLLADIRNPFVENLRVNIDLEVPRNTWLRSRDMNVEMGGELVVVYDRSAGDLVMVGDLQALRGSYGVLNRTFEVDGGTVEFIGRPGVNPALNIQATTRVRRREGEPLEVLATVEGNLVRPLVTLSSAEAGLAQSDLISYLIIGQASTELAGSNSQFLSAGTLGSGFATYATGVLANQVGSALARETGFDYLSISSVQGDFYGRDVGFGGTLAGTQLEAGRYLGEDVFVVVVLRPLGNEEVEADPFGGVRVEWAITDDYNVEAFVEERFLRSGTGGLGAVGLDQDKILGMFFFREWGYR